MAKDIIRMSRKEIDRLMILRGVIHGEVKQVMAAEILGLSERQVRRIVKRIREEGSEGIIHHNRGRPSMRKMSDETVGEIQRLIKKRYRGFGPTLSSEKLREREGIEVSREKLRQLMLEAGLWQTAGGRRFMCGGRGRLIAVRWSRWMARITTGWKDGVRRWCLWAILMMPPPIFLGDFMITKGSIRQWIHWSDTYAAMAAL